MFVWHAPEQINTFPFALLIHCSYIPPRKLADHIPPYPHALTVVGPASHHINYPIRWNIFVDKTL